MNIEQLTYVVEISKTGSISLTSEKLHISQAGISKSLSKLEKELGFPLFTRSRSGMVPTEGGAQLIGKVNGILSILSEIKEEAKQYTELLQEKINLSVSPNFMCVLPQTIALFKKNFPNVRLEITERDTREIVEEVKNNKTDLGLVYIEHANNDNVIGYHSLVDSRISVCVSKHSSFAAKESVTPYELLDESFVNIKGSYSNRFMDDFMTKYGAVNVILTSNNLEVLKRTIAENTAIGFFNEFSIKKDPLLERGDIVLIPLQCEEPAHLALGWIRLKRNHFPTVQKEFIKYLSYETKSVDFNASSNGLIP